MRGAADHNNDAQVTLSEAFAFAYEKTLVRSADSRSGIQHPNYDYEIKGRDELTLTNLAGGAKLIFPESTLGTYLVFHRARGSLVAELEKVLDEEKQLHLPPGDYVIKKRIKNASLLLTASIGSLDNYIVEDSSMKTLPLTDDLSKGYETPIFEPTWKHGAPFTKFTAHTLRQGEWVAGLQSVQYGISDDVTIYTLPLTALFGLPLRRGTQPSEEFAMDMEHWVLNDSIATQEFQPARLARNTP